MRYVVEFTQTPADMTLVSPDKVAGMLAGILNKDLGFYCNAQVAVTPEGN